MSKQNPVFTRDFIEAVIAALLQDKLFLREAASILRPDLFEDSLHQGAVTSIFNSYSKDGVPPSRAGFLHDMVNHLCSTNRLKDKNQQEELAIRPAQKFTERVFHPLNGEMKDVKARWLDFCRTQEMKNAILEVYQRLETEPDLDGASVMQHVRQAYLKVNKAQEIGVDFFSSIKDLPFDLKQCKEKVLTTGFPSLDARMDGGGLTPGTLSTIIAPPKGGKSMSLVNVGFANLLRSKTVLAFTLEISAKKLKRRYASRMSGVPMKEMSLRTSEVIDKVNKFYALHKGRLIIKEHLTGGCSVDTIRGYLYWLEATHGVKPDLVLIDYGDLLRSGVRGDEERMVQRAAYQQMRDLSNEFDLSVVTASQANREAMSKKTIHMNDIAECIAKVAISDHIFALCQTDEELANNRARWNFAGSREGEMGGSQIHLATNWKTCWMQETDLPKEGEAPHEDSKDEEFA